MKKLAASILIIFSLGVFNPPALSQGLIDYGEEAAKATAMAETEINVDRDFRALNLKHAEQVYAWHRLSSIIIFWVILTIIFLGLYFSYIQFQLSVNNKDFKKDQSTMKVGAAGIEVSSSIVGLLILVISLAFFYLYLENVYPVEPVHLQGQFSGDVEDMKS